MMKEFRFEPASQMITVEEGQSLNIDIAGIKTAYRYEKPAQEDRLRTVKMAPGFVAAATERCSL